MADDHQAIALDDAEGHRLHATWSRSRKHVIVTVSSRGAQTQVELTPEQAERLREFLAEAD